MNQEASLDELYFQLGSDDEAQNREAVNRLDEFGAAGARVLVRAVLEYPWPPLGELHHLPEHWGYLMNRKRKDPLVQVIKALARIGTPAIPELAPLLRERRLAPRMSGWMAFFYMDSYILQSAPGTAPMVDDLCAWVREGEESWPWLALEILVKLRHKAKAAATALAWLYHRLDPLDTGGKDAVVETLLKIHPPPEVVADIVADFLRTADPGRLSLCLTRIQLSDVHEPLDSLVPILTSLIHRYVIREDFQNYYEQVLAKEAAETLGYIGASAREGILELTKDPSDRIRQLAVEAIERYTRQANPEDFFDFLLERLGHRGPSPKSNLQEDMILYEARSRYGLPSEIQARWDATRTELEAYLVQYRAELAEKKHPTPTGPEVARLLAELAPGNDEQRKEALERIAKFGPAVLDYAPDLIELLIEPLQTGNRYVRSAAIGVLASLGPRARAAAPELRRIAESANTDMYFNAARRALASIAWG